MRRKHLGGVGGGGGTDSNSDAKGRLRGPVSWNFHLTPLGFSDTFPFFSDLR